MRPLLVCLFAYLIGSISSAIIVCRLKNLPDPRSAGSKNPGATNVLRMGNKSAAMWVALGDVLKGFLPVIVAKWLGVEGLPLAFVALAVVIGHIFPLFFGFKGGKGIATAFGAFLALAWPVAILLAVTWIIILWVFSYSSLAGITTAVLAPIYIYYFSDSAYLPAILGLSILILCCHHANLTRLLQGKEQKIKKNK
jgi:glycerol-3-phosphate acyltransferase PlsY